MLTIFALFIAIVLILAAAVAVAIFAAIMGFKLLFWVAPMLLVIAILLIIFIIGGLA